MDSEHVKVYNSNDKFLDLEPNPTEMSSINLAFIIKY